MKYVATVVAILLALAGIYAYAFLWELDHTALGSPSISPDGFYVSQFYTMPEGSAVPYGLGVWVSYRFIPAWLSSDLVFAAYCSKDEHLSWRQPKELIIFCGIEEGRPLSFTLPHGIKVTHIGSSS